MQRWVLVFVALAVLQACSSDGGGGGLNFDVKLGVVQSLTGDGAVYGKSGVEGMELAIKQLEAANKGLKIDYTVVDDGSDIDRGVQAYHSFVNDGVTAIIGPSLSKIGFPALKVAQDAEIPAISPMTTATGIGEIGDYVFRVALAEDAAIPPLLKRVSQIEPISKAVLFFDGSDAYSLSGADAMRAGMAAIGGEILLEVDLSTTPSLDAVVTGPEAEAADAFLIPTFTETAAPVLVALRSAGHQQPVIGGEAMASLDLVRLAGDAADGTYVDSTWNAEQPGDLSRAFVDAYMKEYGHTPDNYAAVSYASIYLLMDALKRAGSTKPADLRLALATTSDLDTVLGPLSMSADGDAIFQPVLQQFRSGKLVVLE